MVSFYTEFSFMQFDSLKTENQSNFRVIENNDNVFVSNK